MTPPPSLPIWFARVVAGFVRRELVALGGYRAAFFVRLLGIATAVGALLFLSRFVDAADNPHLLRYGGNYLGFVVLGTLGATLQQVGVTGLAQRIRTAQMMGTLEAELATPAPPWMVLGAPPLYEFGAAALRSAGRRPAGSAHVSIVCVKHSTSSAAIAAALSRSLRACSAPSCSMARPSGTRQASTSSRNSAKSCSRSRKLAAWASKLRTALNAGASAACQAARCSPVWLRLTSAMRGCPVQRKISTSAMMFSRNGVLPSTTYRMAAPASTGPSSSHSSTNSELPVNV